MPTTKKNTSKKSTSKQTPADEPASVAKGARRIKQPRYKSFRISKRIKHPKPKILGSFRIFKLSLRVLFKNWRLFGGLALVYTLLTIFLVRGFGSSLNLADTKQQLEGYFKGGSGTVGMGISLFGVLLTSVGKTAGDSSSAYQGILLIIVSLAAIWALRQTHAGKKVGVRDSFYKGLYPFVPFVLILVTMFLQALPMIIANSLYGIVFGGLAVTSIEKALWIVLFFLLVLWSLYMLTSSMFALYIVTLPDVRPMQALRSARELVRLRRWTIMRKVFFLPIALILVGLLLMLPVILFVTPIAEWVFFTLAMTSLLVVHSYIYSLYRELIA